MMQFFQKYQRYILIAITFLIIASFFFFGTYSVVGQAPSREDKAVALAVDGSKLMRSEIQDLARFIATDWLDVANPRGMTPNFCNDGVIRFDLLKGGLATVLVSHYLGSLEKDLGGRLERIKRFRPYVHPEAPILSVAHVWDQFAAGLKEAVEKIQKADGPSLDMFKQLVYLQEISSRLPEDWLKRLLLYQQKQYSWIQPDPKLDGADLSLFGFHSLADWFGPNFVDLCSEFILNASRAAVQKGYQVSLEEARADLIHQFNTTMEKLHQANPKANFSEITLQAHLSRLGFDEKKAAESWRHVLLFRRLFQSVGEAVFIDRLPLTRFASFAGECAKVQLYEWPAALRFRDFSDLVQFQFYLESTSKLSDPLKLPVARLSQEEIESHQPMLVQTSYEATVSRGSLEEIGLCSAVKEVWEWQLNEDNWKTLVFRFPYLQDVAGREERFKQLQALSKSQRLPLDAYARKALVDAHPEWIDNAFSEPGRQQKIAVSNGFCSLREILDPNDFAQSLEMASLTGSSFRYSDDGSSLFQIQDVKKIQEAHILPFEEAKEGGILTLLVQREFEKKYPELRAKHPELFKNENGSWKSLSESQDLIGKLVYADLLQAIDKGEQATKEDYVSRRLLAETTRRYQALKKGDPEWNEGLFKMIEKEHHLQRSDKGDWMTDMIFTQMVPNQWSPIHVGMEDISFFYFQEKEARQTPILKQLRLQKQMIAADAQRYLAESLLELALRNQSIIIPMQGKNE